MELLIFLFFIFFFIWLIGGKKKVVDKRKKSIKKNIKKQSSTDGKNYLVVRFIVVAIILGIGREAELDKQLGGLLTALITLLAFVWVFRGNKLSTYRPGQNLHESNKSTNKVSKTVNKVESEPKSLEDISKEKATKEIKELKELLDSGIISKTEYNNKAKELKKIILK